MTTVEQKGGGVSVIGEGVEILKLIDKGRNADLYKQIGDWIDQVEKLKVEKDELSQANKELKKKLEFAGSLTRIAGRTYAENDDEEICSRCAEVDNLPVHLNVMRVPVGSGQALICPQCKNQASHWNRLSRTEALALVKSSASAPNAVP
jgi:hypothetical protein